jgi:hypothetical protein
VSGARAQARASGYASRDRPATTTCRDDGRQARCAAGAPAVGTGPGERSFIVSHQVCAGLLHELAGVVGIARTPIQLAEAKVAMGHKRTHAEFRG